MSSVLSAVVPFERDARAQVEPAWQRLGAMHLDAQQCQRAPCELRITPTSRHPTFALATDAPFGLTLVGRAAVTCANGSTYHVFLSTPERIGPFQFIANSCLGFDVERIDVQVTSALIRDQDRRLGVVLSVLGSLN